MYKDFCGSKERHNFKRELKYCNISYLVMRAKPVEIAKVWYSHCRATQKEIEKEILKKRN